MIFTGSCNSAKVSSESTQPAMYVAKSCIALSKFRPPVLVAEVGVVRSKWFTRYALNKARTSLNTVCASSLCIILRRPDCTVVTLQITAGII